MISSGFLGIVPIIVVIILYFAGMPVAFALFSASLLYFGVINTSSPVELTGGLILVAIGVKILLEHLL